MGVVRCRWNGRRGLSSARNLRWKTEVALCRKPSATTELSTATTLHHGGNSIEGLVGRSIDISHVGHYLY